MSVFPTTPILDSGTHADGALSASWVTPAVGDDFTMVYSGNMFAGSSNDNAAAWAAIQPADFECYLTVNTLPVAGQVVLLDHRLSPTDGAAGGYAIKITPSTSTWVLRRLDSGTATALSTVTQALGAGDSIGIRRYGSGVEAWIQTGGTWSQVTSVTDTTYRAYGYLAMECTDTTFRASNFGGGTISQPARRVITGNRAAQRASRW